MFLWQHQSDTEILESIRQGDEKVLKVLYKQNYSMVRKYVIENSGTLDDVDDVLQDGIIALWKNVSKRDFDLQVKLSTYFMSIVKNTWLKQLRKNKKVDVADTHEMAANMSVPAASSGIDLQIIRSLLNEIGETCGNILGLFYFDGLDNKSIAERLEFSNTDVVKAKKYQCLKRLKVLFFEKYQREDF